MAVVDDDVPNFIWYRVCQFDQRFVWVARLWSYVDDVVDVDVNRSSVGDKLCE